MNVAHTNFGVESWHGLKSNVDSRELLWLTLLGQCCVALRTLKTCHKLHLQQRGARPVKLLFMCL